MGLAVLRVAVELLDNLDAGWKDLDHKGQTCLLKLPKGSEIVWGPQLQDVFGRTHMSDNRPSVAVFRVESPDFVDTPRGQKLPNVDAVYDENGFLRWEGPAVEHLMPPPVEMEFPPKPPDPDEKELKTIEDKFAESLKKPAVSLKPVRIFSKTDKELVGLFRVKVKILDHDYVLQCSEYVERITHDRLDVSGVYQHVEGLRSLTAHFVGDTPALVHGMVYQFRSDNFRADMTLFLDRQGNHTLRSEGTFSATVQIPCDV